AESFDIRDKERLKLFAANVHNRFGSLDVWVNNAGVANDKPFLDYTEEEWNTIVGINLEAVWDGIRIVSPYMIKQKKGVIINISSFASVIPSVGGAVYGATKAAVSSLTRTTEAELAPYGIRVLGIVPGMINTEISHENIKQNKEKLVRNISAGRLGEAADLAKPIVFLASDAAAYIAGFDVQITGGKFAVQNTERAWEAKKAP
ncbi:MAG: SDR family oxidoreductase, partial [Lachnospiraceae bacterium]